MSGDFQDLLSVFPIRSTMPALVFGGRAIGFLSNTVASGSTRGSGSGEGRWASC